MAVIRWAGFAGENRALEPSLLPDNVVVLSGMLGIAGLRSVEKVKGVAR